MRLRVALALLTVAGPALAQTAAPAPTTPRFGVLAGLNSATFGGSDVQGDTRRRNAFIGGAYVTLPLSATLALRPEVLYAQKGSAAVDSGFRTMVKLDYVEIPVLLQATLPTTSGLRPALYAGPSFSFKARCDLESRSEGVTENVSCDRLAQLANEAGVDLADPGFKSLDVGGVVGGQIGFGLGGQSVGLGVRYTYGFSDIVRVAHTKNRALSVYGSIEFPLGRRR